MSDDKDLKIKLDEITEALRNSAAFANDYVNEITKDWNVAFEAITPLLEGFNRALLNIGKVNNVDEQSDETNNPL